MVQGVQIKVDTSAAVKAQEDFDAVTKRTFATLDEQAKRIRELETRLREVATRQTEAVAAQKAGTDAMASAASGARAVGQSLNTTTGLVQKFAASAGSTGAARALGLFASSARAIVSSVNPAGIAVGLAASAVVTLGANALAAETSLDRLAKRAQEAQQNFSLLEDASAKVSGALAAAARSREAAFGGDRGDALARQVAGLEAAKRAVSDLSAANALNLDFRIPIDQAKDLAKVLDFGTREYLDLEKAAKSSGKERLDAIARLREEAGLLVSLEDAPFGVAAPPTAFIKGEDAIEALIRGIDRYEDRIRALSKLQVENVDPFQDLLRNQVRNADLDKLGPRERDVATQLDRLAKPVTDDQKNAADRALANARALDTQERSTKQLAETERERQRQAEESARAAEKVAAAEQRRADVLEQLRDDTAVLLAVTDDEIRAKKELARINDAIRQADVKPGSDAAKQIEAAVRRNEEAREYAETLDKIGQVGGDAFGAIGQGLANAALNGGTLREMLAGIYQDLLRLAAQRAIVDNLVQAGTFIAQRVGSLFATQGSAASGAATGAAAGAAAGSRAIGGGLPNSSGPMALAARGMLLDSYQTLRAGGTNITVAEGGGSTPEAIVPLQRDRYGRLGVSGGGGGDIIVNMPGVRSAREARQARPTVRQMMGQLQREQQRGMRSGK